MNQTLLSELESVSLGDKRLNRRAIKIANSLLEKSTESFPNIFSASAELEAFYRFVESPYVNSDALLKPHIAASVQRSSNVGDIIIVHDTTEFVFSGKRDGLAPAEKYKSTSYFAHASLAFRKDNTQPLGVLRMKTWVRNSPTKSALRRKGVPRKILQELPSEQDRWFESARATAALFEQSDSLIHVCDSEGDDYTLLAKLKAESYRFVIRGCQNRKLVGSDEKLREILSSKPILAERVIPLSKRGSKNSSKKRLQARESRTANLEIRCASITVPRPYLPSKTLAETIDLNVVYVSEKDPPEGQQGVDWVLLTTEPISTIEEVTSIIDIYRTRWIIEEYFKVLKTGCSYESRQLDSYHTLLNCLALFVPIAWLMLSLRYSSRTTPNAPAESVLPGPLLEVLQLHTGKPVKTTEDTFLAIARLGGHIKNNGAPGLLVLWRGFHELAVLTKGYLLATKEHSPLSRKRCDQS